MCEKTVGGFDVGLFMGSACHEHFDFGFIEVRMVPCLEGGQINLAILWLQVNVFSFLVDEFGDVHHALRLSNLCALLLKCLEKHNNIFGLLVKILGQGFCTLIVDEGAKACFEIDDDIDIILSWILGIINCWTATGAKPAGVAGDGGGASCNAVILYWRY